MINQPGAGNSEEWDHTEHPLWHEASAFDPPHQLLEPKSNKASNCRRDCWAPVQQPKACQPLYRCPTCLCSGDVCSDADTDADTNDGADTDADYNSDYDSDIEFDTDADANSIFIYDAGLILILVLMLILILMLMIRWNGATA